MLRCGGQTTSMSHANGRTITHRCNFISKDPSNYKLNQLYLKNISIGNENMLTVVIT